MHESKYNIIERHNYKDFSIVFCTTKYNKNLYLSYVRNKKWVEIDFICIESNKLNKLKQLTAEFLKKPNLSELNQKKLNIKIFAKDKKIKKYKDYYDYESWQETEYYHEDMMYVFDQQLKEEELHRQQESMENYMRY